MTGKTNGLQLNCSSLLNDSFNFKRGLIKLYRVFSLSFWMGLETLADVYSSADYSGLSHWDVCTSLHKRPVLYISIQYYSTVHFLLSCRFTTFLASWCFREGRTCRASGVAVGTWADDRQAKLCLLKWTIIFFSSRLPPWPAECLHLWGDKTVMVYWNQIF